MPVAPHTTTSGANVSWVIVMVFLQECMTETPFIRLLSYHGLLTSWLHQLTQLIYPYVYSRLKPESCSSLIVITSLPIDSSKSESRQYIASRICQSAIDL